MAANRFVLITGCSGGGKSSLLAALEARGYAVVPEPGRRIVAQEEAGEGVALPWIDPAAFARRAVAMSRADLGVASDLSGLVFFDRGLIDAAVALQHASHIPYRDILGAKHHYADPVFLTPPWPDIYAIDGARRHDLPTAIEEFERLRTALADLGYEISILPKTSVAERADFIIDHLQSSDGTADR